MTAPGYMYQTIVLERQGPHSKMLQRLCDDDFLARRSDEVKQLIVEKYAAKYGKTEVQKLIASAAQQSSKRVVVPKKNGPSPFRALDLSRAMGVAA